MVLLLSPSLPIMHDDPGQRPAEGASHNGVDSAVQQQTADEAAQSSSGRERCNVPPRTWLSVHANPTIFYVLLSSPCWA